MRDLSTFVDYLVMRGHRPETVIDAGVCYGTPALQNGLPEAWHILIDPLVEMEPRLASIIANRRGEYHLTALGAARGEAWLKMEAGAPEGATLAGTDAISKTDARLRTVPLETLDGLLADRDLARPILLKTDCQGYDLEVLKGAARLIPRLDLVVMEVTLFHPASTPALGDFGAVVGWMRDHGFAVFDILSYQTRPRDDALGYVDLAFAREDGPLRAEHRWG